VLYYKTGAQKWLLLVLVKELKFQLLQRAVVVTALLSATSALERAVIFRALKRAA